MEIIDYPNYLIYPDGRVYSKKRNIYLKAHLGFNTKKVNDKYYDIALCKNGILKRFKLHRLLVQHFKPDEWKPELVIDHINRNSLDNRLDNLRCVSHSANSQNQGIRKTNTSGIKNISYRKTENKWVYKKLINGKKIYKRFKTKEEAIKFKEEYEKNNKINIL